VWFSKLINGYKLGQTHCHIDEYGHIDKYALIKFFFFFFADECEQRFLNIILPCAIVAACIIVLVIIIVLLVCVLKCWPYTAMMFALKYGDESTRVRVTGTLLKPLMKETENSSFSPAQNEHPQKSMDYPDNEYELNIAGGPPPLPGVNGNRDTQHRAPQIDGEEESGTIKTKGGKLKKKYESVSYEEAQNLIAQVTGLESH